jgi:hypothetical protein
MKAADLNTKLINSYLELLKNLSPANKLDLIAKLTQSVKSDMKVKSNAFDQAFGGWVGSEPAAEIIQVIRESRQFNRHMEEL